METYCDFHYEELNDMKLIQLGRGKEVCSLGIVEAKMSAHLEQPGQISVVYGAKISGVSILSAKENDL